MNRLHNAAGKFGLPVILGAALLSSCSEKEGGSADFKNGKPSFTYEITASEDMLALTDVIVFTSDTKGNVEAYKMVSREWERVIEGEKNPATSGYAVYFFLKDEYERETGSTYNVNMEYGAKCYVDGEMVKVSVNNFRQPVGAIDNVESYLKLYGGNLANKQYSIGTNGTVTTGSIEDDNRLYSEKARTLLSEMGITQQGESTVYAYDWNEALTYYVRLLKMKDLTTGIKKSYKWDDLNVEITKVEEGTSGRLVAVLKMDFKSGPDITESYTINMEY